METIITELRTENTRLRNQLKSKKRISSMKKMSKMIDDTVNLELIEKSVVDFKCDVDCDLFKLGVCTLEDRKYIMHDCQSIELSKMVAKMGGIKK